MKWRARVFLAVAILVGIYYGANTNDNDRWMAALGLSANSASKLREQAEREKDMARRAAEDARWRAAAQSASDLGAAPPTAFNRDVVCSGIEHRKTLMHSHEQGPDRNLERMMRLCANL